jgi:gliding motility-associated lipoprotein GldH
MKNIIVVFLLVLFTLSSCDKARVYEKNVDFKTNVWHINEAALFDVEIKDADQPYHIAVNVRNSLNYPYRNLYIKYQLADSLGHIIDDRLYEIMLFHPKTGKPYGSGMGDLFDHQNRIRETYRFPYAGNYTISLKQYMRVDELPYIVSTGIRIEKILE